MSPSHGPSDSGAACLQIISINDAEQDAHHSEEKQCSQEVLQRLCQGVRHVIRHVSTPEQLPTALKMRDTHTAYRSLLFKICDGLEIKVKVSGGSAGGPGRAPLLQG